MGGVPQGGGCALGLGVCSRGVCSWVGGVLLSGGGVWSQVGVWLGGCYPSFFF